MAFLGTDYTRDRACFAPRCGKASVSGIAEQEHAVLMQKSRYKACTPTKFSHPSSYFKVSCCLLSTPAKSSGLVIMLEDNINVFCKGLGCTDLTE